MESLPGSQDLLKLEALAKKKGSGIEINSLMGLWKFVSVWGKGNHQEDALSGPVLRLLSASLELGRDPSNDENISLVITNSVKLAFLSVIFSGRGELKGAQPLLSFFFDRLEVKLGSKVLFSRLIDVPQEKARPFFALIAMAPSGKWLSARGRGGGLALWLKDQ